MSFWGVMRVLTLACLILAAGCGGGSSSHTIHGEVSVVDDCPAGRIDEGDPVLLTDGDNKTIGTAELGEGNDAPIFGKGTGKLGDIANDLDLDLSACVYKFRLTGVPDADFYTVEVGDTGEVTFSKAKLKKAGWKMGLSLG